MTYLELKNKLNCIINFRVEKAVAGPSTGSIFSLTFGDIEYLIFVYSSWRLIYGDIIITGWHESNKLPDGPLTKGIKSLEGDEVEDLILSKFFDLNIKFKSGKELQVFCDITPNLQEDEYIDDNWDFSNINENISYTVYKDQSIKVEKYDTEKE